MHVEEKKSKENGHKSVVVWMCVCTRHSASCIPKYDELRYCAALLNNVGHVTHDVISSCALIFVFEFINFVYG